MKVSEFNKITGMSGPEFCKKVGLTYRQFTRSILRGYSYLQPKGKKSDDLYSIYTDILRRCYSKNRKHYKDYGGRGIRMSGEFFYSFKAFAEYMGKKPGPEYSIDRINNDGNYERGNLRWATQREQSMNRRLHKNNVTGCSDIIKVGKKYRVRYPYFYKRFNCGKYISLQNALASYEIYKYRIENNQFS